MRINAFILLLCCVAGCSRMDAVPPTAAAMRDALSAVRYGDIAQAVQPNALRASLAVIDSAGAAERTMDFAEVFFPQYFPAGPGTTALGLWRYRYYGSTGIYIGVNGGSVYVMGGPFGDTPLHVGPVSQFAVTTGSAAEVRLAPLPSSLAAGAFLPLRAVALDESGKVVVDAVPQWAGTTAVARILKNRSAALVGAGSLTLSASVGDRTASVGIAVADRDLAGLSVAMFLGPEETIFNADQDACDLSDQPDTPAKAIRMPDGSLLLFAANDPLNYRFSGADFDTLKRDCRSALRAADDTSPDVFHNREWLSSVYRQGGVVHALIHNEYHDPYSAGCLLGHTTSDNPCWYNSITYASSSDGGSTFSAPPGVSHLVAPPPRRWNGADPLLRSQPFGYFLSSNIVSGPDGYFYSLLMTIVDPEHPVQRGLCPIRTQDLSDPASWRAWNGSSFGLALANPYLQELPATACTLVTSAGGGGGGLHGSLTYNTFLGQYMIVATSREAVDGEMKCGYFFALSADLIHWTRPVFFAPALLPTNTADGACGNAEGNKGVATYATFIDHESTSVNFETVGQVPYLYYTFWTHPTDGTHRNLVRRPVVILKSTTFTGDVTAPIAFLDVPSINAVLSGSVALVAGWAYDEGGLASVQVSVDSALAGSAATGLERPGVCAGVPGVPCNVGYQFALDTTRYANGTHLISIRAADIGGNVTVRSVTVSISN